MECENVAGKADGRGQQMSQHEYIEKLEDKVRYLNAKVIRFENRLEMLDEVIDKLIEKLTE